MSAATAGMSAGGKVGQSITDAGDSLMHGLKDVFNFAVKGVAVYMGIGLLDLALWHYDPGGVALFEAVKDPILNLLDVTGVSDGLNALAGMLGGGTEQIAMDLGGAEVDLGGDLDNTFIPDY